MTDDLVKRERRMDAYWYDFKNTGVDAVDKILSAVAWAGKAYHNTSEWYEECDARDDHTGGNPIEWISNAAKEAADRIEKLEADLEVATMKRLLDSDRIEKLEAALREIAAGYETPWSTSTVTNTLDVAEILSDRINIARKALDDAP